MKKLLFLLIGLLSLLFLVSCAPSEAPEGIPPIPDEALAGQASGTRGMTAQQLTDGEVELRPGWNSIEWPLFEPTAVSEAMSAMFDQVRSVYSMSARRYVDPAQAVFENGQSYWVYMQIQENIMWQYPLPQGGEDGDEPACEGEGEACQVRGLVGACAQGVTECTDVQMLGGGFANVCVPLVEPTEELCDGQDNDCNGEVDDVLPQICDTNELGLCAFGEQSCENGNWGQCRGVIEPQEEVCNLKDEDCDGVADNGFDLQNDANNCGFCRNACGDGETCSSGQCVIEIDGCGSLNVPDATYVLTQDIELEERGSCMTFTADNVKLDCQDHRIVGHNRFSTGIRTREGLSGLTVQNCRVSNFDTSITFREVTSGFIEDNALIDSSRGLWIIGGSDNMISSNTVRNNAGSGIALTRTSDNRLQQNSVTRGMRGIALVGTGPTNLIRNRFCAGEPHLLNDIDLYCGNSEELVLSGQENTLYTTAGFGSCPDNWIQNDVHYEVCGCIDNDGDIVSEGNYHRRAGVNEDIQGVTVGRLHSGARDENGNLIRAGEVATVEDTCRPSVSDSSYKKYYCRDDGDVGQFLSACGRGDLCRNGACAAE